MKPMRWFSLAPPPPKDSPPPWAGWRLVMRQSAFCLFHRARSDRQRPHALNAFELHPVDDFITRHWISAWSSADH